MRTPMTYSVEQIKDWNVMGQKMTGGPWRPVRPEGLQGLFLFHRLRLAWLVFKGQADVLKWGEK